MSEKHVFVSTDQVPDDFNTESLLFPRDKFDLISVDSIDTYEVSYQKKLRDSVRVYKQFKRYPHITLRCKNCGALKSCRDNKKISCREGPCSGGWVDLTGRVFGDLTVVELIHGDPRHTGRIGWYWKCLCTCGAFCYKDEHDLVHSRHVFCPTCARKAARQKMVLPDNWTKWNKAYTRARYAAFKRGYDFELTPVEYRHICEQDCYYCGAHPTAVGKEQLIKNGVDRFDNTKGYSLDNCVPCCFTCNCMKMDHQYADWLAHIAKILKHCEERSTTIPQGSTPKQVEMDSVKPESDRIEFDF